MTIAPLSTMRRFAAAALVTASLVAAPAVAQRDCVVVEDFADAPVGQFPPGWKARDDAARRVYTVQEEEGRKFLHAEARNVGVQAAKALDWDIERRPILAWSWRPGRFPEGAREASGRNDSALGVYAVVPRSRFSVRTVKYIWSETTPVESHFSSSAGMTQVRVLHSDRRLGRWTEASANVLEDYRRLFDDTRSLAPQGIAVLTDADDTGTVAIGDYANFRLCAR